MNSRDIPQQSGPPQDGRTDAQALADDEALAALFQTAWAAPLPVPSAALTARVLADAARLQPRPAAPVDAPVARHVRLWAWLRGAWPELAPMGGLGLAALAGGLWIGLSAPDLAAPLLPTGVVATELFPGDGELMASFTFLSES